MRAHSIPRSRQSGTVLLVALVLLLLAGLLTLFALRVGVFEQRSTGNDVRAKVAGEVAEAGLAQGFEFLIPPAPGHARQRGAVGALRRHRRNLPVRRGPQHLVRRRRRSGHRGSLPSRFDVPPGRRRPPTRSPTSTWRCRSTCCACRPLRRSRRWRAGRACRTASRPSCASRSAPANPAGGIPCGNVGASSVSIATFVSVARLPGENTSSTLVQTVGQYPKLGDEIVRTPPIMASGAVGRDRQPAGRHQSQCRRHRRSGVGVEPPGHRQARHAQHLLCRRILPLHAGQPRPVALPEHDPLRRLQVRRQRRAGNAELRRQRRSTAARAPSPTAKASTCSTSTPAPIRTRSTTPAATSARTTTCARIRCRIRPANSRPTCSATSSACRRGSTTTSTASPKPGPRSVLYQNPDNGVIATVTAGRGLPVQDRRQDHPDPRAPEPRPRHPDRHRQVAVVGDEQRDHLVPGRLRRQRSGRHAGCARCS